MNAVAINLWLARKTFGRKERLRLYRKIRSLLSNGIPLHQALKVLWDQASDNGRKRQQPMALAIQQWMRAQKSGKAFAVALDGWIPVSEQMLLESGETAGRLVDALAVASDLAQTSARITGSIVGGIAYPLMLLLTTAGILWLFGIQVLPQFAQVLPAEKWTGAAAQMRLLSGFVQTWMIPSLVALGLLLVAYVAALPHWTGKLRARLDAYPPWSLYRIMQGSSFLLGLAALTTAGVALPEALRKMRRNASRYMTERLDASLRYVRDGKSIGEALRLADHGFPAKEIISDLEVYATLQGFEAILPVIARQWLDDADSMVQSIMKVLNNLCLMVMAFVIGWLGWGLFDLQAQVTSVQ